MNINSYIYTVYHKSEYTPHISADIQVYLFMGQYWLNDSLTQWKVVYMQLI